MQVLSDLFGWLSWLANGCIIAVQVVYILLARFLPGLITFAQGHEWWHNALLAVFWIGLYLFLAWKCYKLIGAVKESMEDTVYDKYGCALMPFWHWLCYVAAGAMPFVADYFQWPIWTRLLSIPLAVFPIVYLVCKGGLGFVFLLLRQMLLLALVVLFFLMFMPIAVLILGAMMVLFFLGGLGGAIGSSSGRCRHCGSENEFGSSCSACGRSL